MNLLLAIRDMIVGLGSVSGLLSLAWQMKVHWRNKLSLSVSQKGDSIHDRLYIPLGGLCVGLRVVNDGELPITIIGYSVTGPRLKLWGRNARFQPVLEHDDGSCRVPGTDFQYPRVEVLNGRVDERGNLDKHGATMTGHLVCQTQDLLPADLPREIRIKVNVYDHKGKVHKTGATVRVDRSGLRTVGRP